MRSGNGSGWLAIGTVTVAVTLVVAGAGTVDAKDLKAVAVISGCTDPSIRGKVTLRERRSEEGLKEVDVRVAVKGLEPGKHGVHLHEVAACEPCTAAGGHFDPGPAGLSSPEGNHPFHSGDLPNLVANKRVGVLQATTTRVTLSPGPLSLFDANGSSVIIHAEEDIYCPNGPEAGCAAGGRAACGIIEPVE